MSEFWQLFPTHILSLESILGFCHGIAKGGDLNPGSYPLHPINTYIYGVTIAPRVCDGQTYTRDLDYYLREMQN